MRHLAVQRLRVARATAGITVLVASLSGCYTYGPRSARDDMSGAPIEVLLNERGRADVVQSLGADVLSFRGKPISRVDGVLTVAVDEVTYINRPSSRWSGERVSVPESQVRDVNTRRFARGKTLVTVGAAVGGIVMFIVTRSFIVKGDSGGEPTNPPTQQQ
ncbi:MAG: hypothetical protein IT355_11025 [Gemmatimonadaceae bacterium]|nr:hypothetical protein [Gemmatimonadaceae bacterium]